MTESKLADEPAIPFEVRPLHVVEQPATTTNHLEQSAATVIVLLMGSKVVGQIIDALGEERDLHGGGPAVGLVCSVFFDDRCFDERHLGYILQTYNCGSSAEFIEAQ